MDKAIIEVFDRVTHHHHDNRHHVKGWKTNNWLGEYGIMYSVCNANSGRLRTGIHKSSGTVIDDMYEIWNTKLGMKSIAFSYMVQSK